MGDLAVAAVATRWPGANRVAGSPLARARGRKRASQARELVRRQQPAHALGLDQGRGEEIVAAGLPGRAVARRAPYQRAAFSRSSAVSAVVAARRGVVVRERRAKAVLEWAPAADRIGRLGQEVA